MEIGRVLIIDPEPFLGDLIESKLQSIGLETFSANSSQDGIESAQLLKPDVILLSVNLSGEDGYSCLSKLRKISSLQGVSIALMAALHRTSESLEKGLELGADDFLRKPIEPVELVARVRSLLRLRRHISQLEQQSTKLMELNRDLEKIAIRDPLTGLYTRRYLEQRLQEEMERTRRYGQPLTFVIADIDHFKKVNDTYGHLVGDQVLKNVALIFQQSIRKVDLAARFGGEEFVVIAPAVDREGSLILTERLRSTLASTPLTIQSVDLEIRLQITASFGIAILHGRDHLNLITMEEFMHEADTALYAAKSGGRNRVVINDDA